MYNAYLKAGKFPLPWKTQRLVLINKGKGNPNSPSAYRPLCMLNTTGKLLEKLIKPRLETAIQEGRDLSPRQYGLWKERLTVLVVWEIVETVHSVQNGNHFSRQIVLLATLDVRNAFNSAMWIDMIDALKKFEIPRYLLRMISSYLTDRVLTYATTDGTRRKQITAGAAQESILGPNLWNVSYDAILRIEMPENTYLSGYVDDIVVVIAA